MKKSLLSFFACIIVSSAFAQKTEFRLALNSGLFAFSGNGTAETSFINYNDRTQSGNTNNPYGSHPALSYGLSGNIKRVTKKNLLLGIDLGYENLRSKVLIDGLSGYTGTTTYTLPLTGSTILNSYFINIFPSIGQRFKAKQVNIDLVAGFDVAINQKIQERGNANTSDGIYFTTDTDRGKIDTEIRPRIQLSADYHKMGIYAGYSYGLISYKAEYVGSNTNDCFARFFRLGLTYQIF